MIALDTSPEAQDRTIRPDGACVYWTPAARVPRQALADALASVGLESMTPARRRAVAALRDALEAVAWTRRAGLLVRPLAGHGWEIVAEGKRTEANEYQHVSFASIDGAEQITTDLSAVPAGALADWYTAHRDDLDGDQVTACLVAVVAGLHGLPLRDRGGFYWLPADRLDTWRRLAAALAQAQAAALHTMRVAFDADSAAAVTAALAAEITAEAGRLIDEAQAGTAGKRALEARRLQACDLAVKVARYEAALATQLPGLRQACEEAETAAAVAQMELAAAEARQGDRQPGLFGGA